MLPAACSGRGRRRRWPHPVVHDDHRDADHDDHATTTTTVDVVALQPPAPAGYPAGLAAQIVAAERALRDPAPRRPTSLMPPWPIRWPTGSSASTRSGTRPSTPRYRRTCTCPCSYAAARREFRAGDASTTLPGLAHRRPGAARRAPGDLPGGAAATSGCPWRYLAAIHLVETGTGRIRGTSAAGAQGPMQFLPATWEAYGGGGDINDTRDAIHGAARYLAANRAPATWTRAVALQPQRPLRPA